MFVCAVQLSHPSSRDLLYVKCLCVLSSYLIPVVDIYVTSIIPQLIKDITPAITSLLPTIIKEVSTTIIDTTKNTLKNVSNVNDITKNIMNPQQEFRKFIDKNGNHMDTVLKEREDIYDSFTRSDNLLNMYNDCMAEEPIYIPRKFRSDAFHVTSTAELNSVIKFEQHRFNSECEILTHRRTHFKKELEIIDTNIKYFVDYQPMSEEELEIIDTNIKDFVDYQPMSEEELEIIDTNIKDFVDYQPIDTNIKYFVDYQPMSEEELEIIDNNIKDFVDYQPIDTNIKYFVDYQPMDTNIKYFVDYQPMDTNIKDFC